MIRRCTDGDLPTIEAIVNGAAEAYRRVIPDDCWHEPYLTRAELEAEIAAGVEFWGWEESGALRGVMGVQRVRDTTLIRHAYVARARQGEGIGSALLQALAARASGRLLVGTWASASWAIQFYERNGFRLVADEERDRLLRTYWDIAPRQREVSVVLERLRPLLPHAS